MTKRLRLTAGFALTSLTLASSIGLAQAPRPVTVEFQNAPLSQVMRAFGTYSGSIIVLAPDVGDPEMTATIENVDWRLALDRIVDTRALVARTGASGVIRIERRRPVTVSFQNARLSQVIRGFAGYSGRTIALAPDIGDLSVTAEIEDTDWQRALDTILAFHALAARVDASGAIRIETRNPARVGPPGVIRGDSR